MSSCLADLTISTLKTTQVKCYDRNILELRKTKSFIQNLAKEAPVAWADPDVLKMRERLIQKLLLLNETY